MEKEIQIIALDIQNEMDIMLAHRRGMQFAKFSGFSLSEQTRFATAVSEICRNSLEYGINSVIKFSIVTEDENHFLVAMVKDQGKGISNLSKILERSPESHKGRGLGIVFARKLSDKFKITTSGKGTNVELRKTIPPKNFRASKLIIDGWLKHLQKEPVISAYEELKMRNIQLVELTEELKANSKMVETQMEEIKKLNEKLSNNNDRLKEFTYAISHDLKTPLSSLLLSSEYIENNPDEPDLGVYKGILTRSIKRMNKTIMGLIEIIDGQHQDQQMARDIEFGKLFSEAREEYEQFIKEARAEIITDFTAITGIRYIEGYLQSLFHNLLSNSLKYRNSNTRLKVKVTTKLIARKIVLTFQDNGIGMDLDKIKDRLFTPFSRFSSETEGKGIGLYLVKGMIESNGGTVSVESKMGEGTIFSFTLMPYK
jgi:signal transduction histidine kinase